MSEQNQEVETVEIEEGAGLYDFSQLMEEEPQEEEERTLPIEDEKEEEKPEEQSNLDLSTDEDKTETEETKSEEEKPKEEEKVETKTTEKNSVYANLAKKYIEVGTWQDVKFEVEGEEKVLSELEDLDEETFLEIVKAQDAQKSSDLDEKFINKEDLDDISLKIIEISKNGGDIAQVLKAKETYIDNLNTYNLDNEDHQEALVRQMYKMGNPNLSEKQINNLINTDKEEIELADKAKTFADNLKQSYHTMLDKQKEEALELKKQQEQNNRELRKGLKQSLADLGITKEAMYKPLIDSATKETEGSYLIDEQFAEMKQDPKELAEFLFWKNNREDYLKTVSEKETSKAKKDTLMKLDLMKGKHQNKKQTKSSKEEDKLDEFASRMKFI